MSRRNPIVLVTALAASLGLAGAALAGTTPATGTTTDAAAGTATTTRHHSTNYEMYRARRSIHYAERDLTQASSDYSGHRSKALDLLKQAEAEIDAAVPPSSHSHARHRTGSAASGASGSGSAGSSAAKPAQ